MFNITEGGLKPLNNKIELKENTFCYYGASSSPKHVIISRLSQVQDYRGVTINYVHYYSYPYLLEHKEDMRIFKDLAISGTKTEIKNLENFIKTDYCGNKEYCEKKIEYLKNILSSNHDKLYTVDYLDYQRWEAIVKQIKPVQCPRSGKTDIGNHHAWYYLEQFGSIGGLEDDTEFEVVLTLKSLRKLEQDKNFKILSKKLNK